MAKPTVELIRALRVTAARLKSGAHYRWTHMGACNCGHLAQTVTQLTQAQIREFALRKAGDWGQQAIEFCPTSGYEIDQVLSIMLDLGMSRTDIGHLERLSGREILRRLPLGQRDLSHRDRDDVVRYMETWAEMLEEQMGLPPDGETPAAEPPAAEPPAAGAHAPWALKVLAS